MHTRRALARSGAVASSAARTLAAAPLGVVLLAAAPLEARLRMMWPPLTRGAAAAIETTLTRAAARRSATSLLVVRARLKGVRAKGEGEG